MPSLPAGDHRPGAGDALPEELPQEVPVAAAPDQFTLGAVLIGVDQGVFQARRPPQPRELLQEVRMGGAGAATAQPVGRQGRVEADPAVFRDDEGGRGAEAGGRGQPQGQVEQGSAPHGQLRRLGKLHPEPQVVQPVRTVVAEQRRRQGLLDGGQLPEIVVAHQEQALPGLQPIQGPHQGIEAAGEQHHPVRAPGVGPLPLQAQVQGRFPAASGSSRPR